jgi:hypothetical protein
MKNIGPGDELFRSLFGSWIHCPKEGPLNSYFNDRMIQSEGGKILHKYWAWSQTREQGRTEDMALLLNEVLSQESD